jgi:hypothetical protein
MHLERRHSRSFAVLFTALLCAASLAGEALGATDPEQTREGYVAQVEPICKTNTQANERILKGARKEVREGKLGLAAARFAKAAAAFGRARKQIAAVPQPVADAPRLTKWVGLLGKERTILAQIGNALRAHKKSLAQRLTVKLTHNSNSANNTVLGFEFNYCLIDSSRFT